MINLRYHIVSLVAVFLALALGVLMGTTVLDQGVVRVLQGQRNQLAADRQRLEAENGSLRDELRLWDGYGDETLQPRYADRLTGRRVVLLVQDAAEPALLDGIEDALRTASATVAGRVTFTDKWALADQTAHEQLALAISTSTTDREELVREAAARLAARMRSPVTPDRQTDLLRALERAGFLGLGGLLDGVFPPRGATTLLVASGDPKAEPSAEEFLLPLLRALSGARPVAVAEALGAADSLSGRIRQDDDLAGVVATIDHADTVLGAFSLVVAIEDLARGRGARHFGAGRRAEAVAPSAR